jgi:hypothetical protein
VRRRIPDVLQVSGMSAFSEDVPFHEAASPAWRTVRPV